MFSNASELFRNPQEAGMAITLRSGRRGELPVAGTVYLPHPFETMDSIFYSLPVSDEDKRKFTQALRRLNKEAFDQFGCITSSGLRGIYVPTLEVARRIEGSS